MLISHKYKFIFIKTRKTAGTSIQVDLAKIMADDDVVMHAEDLNILTTSYFRRFCTTEAKRYFRLPSDPGQYSHMAARDVKKRFGEGLFGSYFKFCVEREPIDKCISMYWHKTTRWGYIEKIRHGGLSWEKFLDRRKLWPIDTRLWTDEVGHLMVDRILRYENLNEEICQVGQELGFNIERIKARHKTSTRRPGIEVSAEQREMIYQAFAESNRHTGYRL
ncbi:MAG: sulfotransferase family 2 domain-containing protein [Rhodobacteraceae bacterium]|nr:sulfotransferase family 2 domain-containing protein [Paracoccaceae bacterium]